MLNFDSNWLPSGGRSAARVDAKLDFVSSHLYTHAPCLSVCVAMERDLGQNLWENELDDNILQP